MRHRRIGYQIVDSPCGYIGIVWKRLDKRVLVIEIVLPMTRMERYIQKHYPQAQERGARTIERVSKQLRNYFADSSKRFPLEDIDVSQLCTFQKTVLFTQRKIPYGRVSTYGRIAVKIGSPKAARAVGTALARNPFPIIIPCHRAIRANGTLGGYQGGVKLKRQLLAREGVQFTTSGTVVMNKVW